MKRLFFILITMGCIMFYVPASGNGLASNNGGDEKTNEQSSIKSPESKGRDGGSHGDIKPATFDSEQQTIHESNERDPITESLSKDDNGNVLSQKKETDFLRDIITKYDETDFLRDFITEYGEYVFSAMLAIFLGLTIREAILGFLQKPKLVFWISVGVIILFELFGLWLGFAKNWLYPFVIPILTVFVVGPVIYLWVTLSKILMISLAVFAICYILSILLPIDDVFYYSFVGVLGGIVGGLWSVWTECKEKLRPICNEFRNRLSKTKSRKEKDVEDVKGED